MSEVLVLVVIAADAVRVVLHRQSSRPQLVVIIVGDEVNQLIMIIVAVLVVVEVVGVIDLVDDPDRILPHRRHHRLLLVPIAITVVEKDRLVDEDDEALAIRDDEKQQQDLPHPNMTHSGRLLVLHVAVIVVEEATTKIVVDIIVMIVETVVEVADEARRDEVPLGRDRMIAMIVLDPDRRRVRDVIVLVGVEIIIILLVVVVTRWNKKEETIKKLPMKNRREPI